MDDISELLMCIVCWNRFINPKLLACRHMFCANCITFVMQNSRLCPLCHQTVRFIHILNDNKLIVSISNIYRLYLVRSLNQVGYSNQY